MKTEKASWYSGEKEKNICPTKTKEHNIKLDLGRERE